MLDATTKARAFVKGIDEQAFLNNEEKIFAVIHALERIGEAAKHVPAGVKKEVSSGSMAIDRRDARQVDSCLFDVHVERLWFTVRDDLPGLEQALRTILIEMD
ncbi:MAG TPA: DUF86 domain-containing protein [Methanoregulaceae archaeon]|nr:DUF86 domain-containing protein [Methanoregulaceae archaeon]